MLRVSNVRSSPWSLGPVGKTCGGIFVAGSLAWGMVVDGFRPDSFDIVGAAICLVGVGVIMFALHQISPTA